MILKIGEGFLSLNTTKDIWDNVSKTYYRRGNIAQVYDLQRSVDHLDQAEMTTLSTILLLLLYGSTLITWLITHLFVLLILLSSKNLLIDKGYSSS